MEKEDIKIKQAIIHILDCSLAVPVLSDVILDFDDNINNFLVSHIYKIFSGDDFKECFFKDENNFIYSQLKIYSEENFIDISKKFASNLFQFMKKNIEIPSGDLIILTFELFNETYLSILKMNYKSSYIHYVETVENDTINSIILQKSALPAESQKLEEAVIINILDYSIKLIEKKYQIGDKKENYISNYYLNCTDNLSAKTKLNLITKTVENINKKYFNDDIEKKIEVKKTILDEYEQNGSIVVNTLADKIFENQIDIKEEFKEEINKYGFNNQPLSFQSKNITKKIEKQIIKTDLGIEINIPVTQYENKEAIEFISNANGSISIIIKNIYNI